jgi:phage shock protein E
MRRSSFISIFAILATLVLHAVPLPAKLNEAQLQKILSNTERKELLLDVRTTEEFAEGHILGAILMPYDEIVAKFKESDKNRPIIVYCRSGRRSAIAVQTLKSMGYRDVSDFGGISNWNGALKTR